jgi:5-methylcytosine-specific restriction endonuclease McrA
VSSFSLSRVSGAPVSDAELLSDLRRVAEIISRTSVRQREYGLHGTYAPGTLASRFGSWNNALAAAGLESFERSISTELLLADLRRVADEISQSTVSIKQYRELGKHDHLTLTNRFGSWKKVLLAAELGISKQAGISDEMLFENILRLWEYYGRQPRRRELTSFPSTISQGPYWRRFGSWTVALANFVEFINAEEATPASDSETDLLAEIPESIESISLTPQNQLDIRNTSRKVAVPIESLPRRRTPRDPSLRLRYKVLVRDNFSCCQCGRSPATELGIILHIDHEIPWSKGGDTVFENLRVLCKQCNLGKSDLVLDKG